jgi:SAM-dependent methyltransferase
MSIGIAEPLDARLAAYYTRYYRDTLAIPGWRELVAVRVDDSAYERRHVVRLEAALARPIRGCRVLNVGCGTGGFTAPAVAAGARVHGVDSSHEAARIAAARGAPTAQALAETLPFRDASFDVVYCFSTLEHVGDAAAALREMLRVVTHDGRLYLHTPNRWACYEGHYKVVWLPGMPHWLARIYLRLRRRPTAFVTTLRPLSLRACGRYVEAAGGSVVRVCDGDERRRVGGALWPLIDLYYRVTGVRPYLEIVAARRSAGGAA